MHAVSIKLQPPNSEKIISSNDFIYSISKHFFRMASGQKCKSSITWHLLIEFPQPVLHYSRHLQHLVKNIHTRSQIFKFSLLTGESRNDYTHNSNNHLKVTQGSTHTLQNICVCVYTYLVYNTQLHKTHTHPVLMLAGSLPSYTSSPFSFSTQLCVQGMLTDFLKSISI